MLRTIIFVQLLLLSTSLFAQVKIAGHRGGYYHQYPENSFPLFQYLADQFKGDTLIVEVDLRTSKEGTPYLMHDETLDRTTTGSGKINDQPEAYLYRQRLKDKSGAITTYNIPTFDEALNFIKTRNINLMLDIKEPIHTAVLDLVKKHNLESRVVVLTFRKEYTQLVAENYPGILLSALIETEADLNALKLLSIQRGKGIAYINSKTPKALIAKLREERIFVMADVSEDLRNNGKPLSPEGYKDKVQVHQLDILISDFPIEASRSFRK